MASNPTSLPGVSGRQIALFLTKTVTIISTLALFLSMIVVDMSHNLELHTVVIIVITIVIVYSKSTTVDGFAAGVGTSILMVNQTIPYIHEYLIWLIYVMWMIVGFINEQRKIDSNFLTGVK